MLPEPIVGTIDKAKQTLPIDLHDLRRASWEFTVHWLTTFLFDAELELDPTTAKDQGEWCLLTVLLRLKLLDG